MGLFSFLVDLKNSIKFTIAVSALMTEQYKLQKNGIMDSIELLREEIKQGPPIKRYISLVKSNELRMNLLGRYGVEPEELESIYFILESGCDYFLRKNEYIPIMAICEIDILEKILRIYSSAKETASETLREQLVSTVLRHYSMA